MKGTNFQTSPSKNKASVSQRPSLLQALGEVLLGTFFFTLNLLLRYSFYISALSGALTGSLIIYLSILLPALASGFLVPFLTFAIISSFITKGLWKNILIFTTGNILFVLLSITLLVNPDFQGFLDVLDDPTFFSTLYPSQFLQSVSSSAVPSILGYLLGAFFLGEKIRKRPALRKTSRRIVKSVLLLYVTVGCILLFFSPAKYLFERLPTSKPSGEGSFLYAGFCEGKILTNSKVLIYSLEEWKKVKTITLRSGDETFVLPSRDGEFIYAVNSNSGNFGNKLMVIDAATNRPIKTIKIGSILGSHPRQPFLGGDYIFVPTYGLFTRGSNKVAVINSQTFEVEKVVDLMVPREGFILAITASTDGKYLFYSYRPDKNDRKKKDKIAKVDVETNNLLKEIDFEHIVDDLELLEKDGRDILYVKARSYKDPRRMIHREAENILVRLDTINLEERGREKGGKIDTPRVDYKYSYDYTGVADEYLSVLDKESGEMLKKISLPKYSHVTQVVEIER